MLNNNIIDTKDKWCATKGQYDITADQKRVNREHDYALSNDGQDPHLINVAVGTETLVEISVTSTTAETTHILKGRRIVDIGYLFEQIQAFNLHSSINGVCNFSSMECFKEVRQGLKSNFFFKCKICGFEKFIASDRSGSENEMLDLNYASTLASYAIGTGFFQTEEFFANLEIPFMSSSAYDKQQKIVQHDVKIYSEITEKEALEEEKQIAISHNEVDVNNTPLLKVKIDGSWSKRSFFKSFSASSGCACIVGLYTNKVIWHGTKNKYCKKCANDSFRGTTTEHQCNTNYHGPPTGKIDLL